MTRTAPSVEIRAPLKGDFEAVAHLAGELGYPSTAAEIQERLAAVAGDPHYAAFVAVDHAGHVLGWIQLTEVRPLTGDPRAEITGLVVASSRRGGGVGRLLVERGENWARERALAEIGLHSNVLRERAHEFYLRLGYRVTKSQKVFRKDL